MRSDGAIRFVLAVTIVFIMLKIFNIVDWEWIWVVSPILIGVVLEVVLFVIVFVCGLIDMFLVRKKK
jgi:hypothetical protein